MTIFKIGAEALTWTRCSAIGESSVGYDNSTGGAGPHFYIDSFATLVAPTPLTEAWVRFNIQAVSGSTPASLPLVAFFDSTTEKDALRISWVGTNEFEVSYNSSGTTYTSLGTFYSAFAGYYGGVGVCWDVYFKRGASGVARVFVNNVMVFEYTGALNTVDSTFDGVIFRGNDDIRNFAYGAVIFSDEPMFNARLATLRPTGLGNETAWSLTTFSNVDDTGFQTNFEDGVYVNSAGSALTHAMGDLGSFTTDRRYPAVVVYVHAAISAGATPTGMNFRIRQGSTNYTKAALGVTPGEPALGYSEMYTTDMVGSPWTVTNINSLQVGLITT